MNNYCPTCKNYKASDDICEDCGTFLLEKATKTCPKCGKENRVDLQKCINCKNEFAPETYTFKKSEIPKKPDKASQINSEQDTQDTITGFRYRTLLAYGKFISGFGWLVVILSTIGIITGIARSGQDEGLILSGVGFMAMLMGIGMVVSGQLISCFVSIEKNTRYTYELLKQK